MFKPAIILAGLAFGGFIFAGASTKAPVTKVSDYDAQKYLAAVAASRFDVDCSALLPSSSTFKERQVTLVTLVSAMPSSARKAAHDGLNKMVADHGTPDYCAFVVQQISWFGSAK